MKPRAGLPWTPAGWDPSPSLLGCARVAWKACTLLIVVFASANVAALIVGGRSPEPLLRAACASRAATDAGLALVPVLDLDRPHAREYRDALLGRATQARQAWESAPWECP